MQSKVARWSLLAGLLALAGSSFGQAKVREVTARKLGEGVEVRIKGEGLAKPKELRVSGGRSYILEFKSEMPGKAARFLVNHGGLTAYRTLRYKNSPPTMRVQFTVSRSAKPVLTQSSDGWAVTFGHTPTASATEPTTTPLAQKATTPLMAMVNRHANDDFPTTVPPLDPPAPKSLKAVVDSYAKPESDGRITLDFANTDVVQILKALAMQAGVNVVTAPEVKGTLTVTLDGVTVKEGLDLVTALAGAKYAKVGNSYVVTAADRFNPTMKQLTNKGNETMLETRVIPIYSGEARSIRASVLSSLQQGWAKSQFQIMLPTDEFKITSEAQTGANGEQGPGSSKIDITGKEASTGLDAGATTSGKESLSVRGLKEQYLILVGPGEGMGEVESKIRELDKLVLSATGGSMPTSPGLVRRTYSVKSDDLSANDLVKALSSQGNNRGLNVDLFPAPPGLLNQTIVIVGRDNEVDRAEQMLKELDFTGYGTDYFIYNVKAVDPRQLRDALIGNVKGLRVTVPPGAPNNFFLHQPGKATKESLEAVDNTGKAPGASGGSGTAADRRTKADTGGELLVQPYREVEKTTVPMKLLLRGTKEQIEEALAYLARVDVVPKQVALEMRVMELTKEDAVHAGIDWNLFSGGVVSFIRLNNSQASSNNAAGVRVNDRNVRGDVVATLDKIANKTNLIARPNLVATDGLEAELFVGDAIRYIESIIASQNGITVTTGTVRVGVRLMVLPRIGGEGSITMDLRPVVSFLRGFKQIAAIQGELPQTSERIAQTTLTIQSGETIAIGGLIQDQDRKEVSGVPILMDLPIVGALFRKSSTIRNRTELVIFLTAKEIDGALGANSPAVPMRGDLKGNETTKRVGG